VSSVDYGELSMLELFKLEAETQTQVLTTDLLALEREPRAARLLESCMRAAHSLKGAARIIGLNPGVSVTHAMEDCFVAAQSQRLTLSKPQIDLLLRGVDLILKVATANDAQLVAWSERDPPEVRAFVAEIQALLAGPVPVSGEPPRPEPLALDSPGFSAEQPPADSARPDVGLASPAANDGGVNGAASDASERALRVSAQNFNRLLGLAAQSLVESRWLGPFHGSLQRLMRQQGEAAQALELVREGLSAGTLDERTHRALAQAREKWRTCLLSFGERLGELDGYERRVAGVTSRLYDEALTCRMRPFSDALVALPRMVRDLAQSLGKQARLEVVGESAAVDRDVLAQLEAPLNHLLRNAVDHGIDSAETRRALGKSETGVVRLEARHVAGMLQISVSDDGQGIDLARVRRAIVSRGLIDEQTAEKLSDSEVYEFLFLPGFTVRDQVTEISGRGVGLDVVQSAVKLLRGSVQASSRPGQGATFQLHVPLTVSVVRTLIADIGGQPYAFPLAHIDRTLRISPDEIETLEGRQHFEHRGARVGLVLAQQIFAVGERQQPNGTLPLILVSDQQQSYGLVVDRLRGVHELVVQPLDPRLGKIKDIAAGALLENGDPVLIVDVEDLLRSVEKLALGGHLSKVRQGQGLGRAVQRKRVLVVDDSFTVRELERKLIDAGGYEVDVAVDGMDGWNAVRVGAFDLVVTDIDMPRMDGIELVKLIRKDTRLRSLPVMIVSYKDREADRQRGLEAGADYYLAKGNFKNEGLLQAVVDLIGEASA
jgi:two-component system sensor histidine kinase and response regulator WspE